MTLLLLAGVIAVVAVVAWDPPTADLTAPASPAPAQEEKPKADQEAGRDEPTRSGPKPRCPPGGGNCRVADGRILYVERVDPDGDGDAHFVLASSESVTGPGISIVDVKRSLRPSPLPGPGDFLRAAGPVFEGSHGQSQIEATAVQAGQ